MFHAPVFTRFEIYIKSPSALRIQFVVAQEVKRVQKSSLFPSGSITRKYLILPSKSSGGDWAFYPSASDFFMQSIHIRNVEKDQPARLAISRMLRKIQREPVAAPQGHVRS